MGLINIVVLCTGMCTISTKFPPFQGVKKILSLPTYDSGRDFKNFRGGGLQKYLGFDFPDSQKFAMLSKQVKSYARHLLHTLSLLSVDVGAAPGGSASVLSCGLVESKLVLPVGRLLVFLYRWRRRQINFSRVPRGTR